MKLRSTQAQVKIIEDKRKVILEKLFDKLEDSEDKALLLVLIQSYKDEIENLKLK